MSIFTITLVSTPDNPQESDITRCIGYLPTLQEAKDAVMSNQGEMHECLYNYAVIEEHRPGLWRNTVEEYWFAWKEEKKSWYSCKKPAKYRQFATVTGFGMG